MPTFPERVTKFLQEHPKLGDALLKASKYNLLEHRGQLGGIGAGAGGLLGAAVGLVIMRKANTKGKVKGAITGGLTGAGAGFMMGYYGPEAIQKGVGRIATNIRDPAGYDMEINKKEFPDIRESSLAEKIKAVLKDKPAYDSARGAIRAFNDPADERWFSTYPYALRSPYSVREVPYRLMFGLEPREFKDVFLRDLKTNELVINPQTEFGKEMKKFFEKARASDVKKFGDLLLGHASLGKNKTTDIWDFALAPNEKVNDYPNLLRALASMIVKPQPITIYYDEPEETKNK